MKGQDVAANAIDSSKVPSDALTGSDIRESTLELTGIPSGPPSVPASGDLTGSYPNPLIAANSIGGPEIQGDSVSVLDIGPNAVGCTAMPASKTAPSPSCCRRGGPGP